MNKLQRLLILFLLIIVTSCDKNKPEWLKEHYHVTSPDGKAFIFEKSYTYNGEFYSSIATWISTENGSGGAGVLDLKGNKKINLDFEWMSDSTVLITYDSAAKILRIESDTYFLGRSTKLKYSVKQSRTY
jgi:hypothetical protein